MQDSANGESDYQLVSPDQTATVKIYQDAVHPSHNFKLMQLAAAAEIASFFSYDPSMQPASDLYLMRFSDFKKADFNQLPVVTLRYATGSPVRGVYYYDWTALKFERLEAIIDATTSQVSFVWPDQEELIFCLFRDPELSGKASWYTHPKFRNQLIAASVDYPMGTKLKVINTANNKEVIVTVKDYGPNKKIHPDRVVDLSKPAFRVLAPLSAGVIKVKVVPLAD